MRTTTQSKIATSQSPLVRQRHIRPPASTHGCRRAVDRCGDHELACRRVARPTGRNHGTCLGLQSHAKLGLEGSSCRSSGWPTPPSQTLECKTAAGSNCCLQMAAHYAAMPGTCPVDRNRVPPAPDVWHMGAATAVVHWVMKLSVFYCLAVDTNCLRNCAIQGGLQRHCQSTADECLS